MMRLGRGLSVVSLWGGVMMVSLASGCGGGAPPPAAAVGQLGGDLSARAHAVPQGAELCALSEAVDKPPGKAGASVTEPCADEVESDELWRRSLVVLSAYGAHLEALAKDEDPEISGRLRAALTGIRGPNWIDVEDNEQKAARTAAADLVRQLDEATSDSDLEGTVQAAAPHVEKVCDGLIAYLAAQTASAAELRAELLAKEKAPASRRCAMVDNRPICMADNVVDHLVYASEFGRLASLEAGHRDAGNAVAAFCAAHAKLDEAAAAGTLSDDTTRAVIDEIRRAIPERAPSAPAEDASTAAQP